MYAFLDKFFFVFHSSLILFNCFGWIWKKTRKTNLIVLLMTVFSWFFLGIWYGYGYCPCTDWHWQVRGKLGFSNNPDSYIEFLIETFTGLDVSSTLVDIFALVFLVAALFLSLLTNFLDWDKLKKTKDEHEKK
ncbi:MAG: DUF2784 domain-containing protein [Candidatus Aminicenantes bacterium]|nr:DUF2784 domain-containing protein [Candidatus Aminicenantes bacterium]